MLIEAQLSPIDRFMNSEEIKKIRETMRERIIWLPRLWGYKIGTEKCTECAKESRRLLVATLEELSQWLPKLREYANEWEKHNDLLKHILT